MHSLTTTPSFPSTLHLHLTPSLVPPLFFSFASTRKVERVAVLGHEGSLKKGNWCKGLCWSWSRFHTRCKDWNSIDSDFSSLEAEILEFMQNSDNPEAFPSKEELVAAGRVDLAEAIVNQGGWLAYGWDLNEGSLESNDFEDGNSSEIDGNATRTSGVASSSSLDNSSQPAKSVEIDAEESGIEGILNRLEKERSSSFGLGFGEKEDNVSSQINEDKDGRDLSTSADGVTGDLEIGSKPSSLNTTSGSLSDFQIKHDQRRSPLDTDNLRNSLKPETWRSWINQRTGFLDADFEDAEIVPRESEKGGVSDVSGQSDILKTREFSHEPINRETGLGSLDGIGNTNHIDIKSRIQHLESELSSVLHTLRSSAGKVTMQTDQKSSSDDLAKLSDDWEFQENEIINAQDRLRSLRAKLAILEGKMALTIMDAQKVVEEKQKKINNAHKVLKILKTTCIIWPNTASEVFLAGSFDGWSTQRRMEKSNTGVFSLYLQLYPGKYEIKFIVDGEWKIDPLRPIVNNNGYENNLLIIHD